MASVKTELTRLLEELYAVCGWKSRLAAPIVGRHLFRKLKQEEVRLGAGWTYEPPTFYETNQPQQVGNAVYVQGVAARGRVSDGSPVTPVGEHPLSRAG